MHHKRVYLLPELHFFLALSFTNGFTFHALFPTKSHIKIIFVIVKQYAEIVRKWEERVNIKFFQENV